ncbi:cisplatin damage response ATP-dependent DNA ligase [Labrys wisconsinensis]|uniref:DNA ligase (ATP) n=1 Tax=Labrys wisconsinensis TaxID=425677 RepID=A0ABU0JDI6_9HYPH|nr:cisplatin damage response ATP-dependent DNA ligase [Labrys wisconsinensis]MDQ0472346.1 DNA ligase-1 [Labrys wisconsinensis]
MNRFAELLDRLAYEPRRNAKLRLLTAYFRETPDPDRGFALAALTGNLVFRHAKPGLIRALVAERTDPELFALSYDFVGDLSETVALIWPARAGANRSPTLAEVVAALTHTGKSELPGVIARLLDALDETGRWALLKLITGALRIGASARLAKTAVAMLGEQSADEVELAWPGLAPPYAALFAWVEGRAGRPETRDPAPFRPVMLSHALEEADLSAIDPEAFVAEWKWDGIRVQAVGGPAGEGRVMRLYSRTGEDISAAFPDLMEALSFDGAVDGELLVRREELVRSFNVLQQRLNRKTVTPRLALDYPAHIRAYDLLAEGGEDLRELSFVERRRRLEAFVARLGEPRLDLSPLVPFADVAALAAARADPAAAGAGPDAEAVEGIMLKRRDSPYLPGRPKGFWFKWKREPFNVDAVLMYAQRGHGKRSSFYSDYTFGVWTEEGILVPVGKAYFGFTDEELLEIDRFVRRNTLNRFGPVREVTHEPDKGLVFEVAFEGIARSTRHKSGVAMRFPRIARIRWDKPPREADRLETLIGMIKVE